jgi:hypothetical protein
MKLGWLTLMATNKVKRREIYLPAKHLCSLQQEICSL